MRIPVDDTKLAFLCYLHYCDTNQNLAIDIVKNFFDKFTKERLNFIQFALNKKKILTFLIKKGITPIDFLNNIRLHSIFKFDPLNATKHDVLEITMIPPSDQNPDFFQRFLALELNPDTKIEVMKSILEVDSCLTQFFDNLSLNPDYYVSCLTNLKVARFIGDKIMIDITRDLFLKIIQHKPKEYVELFLELDKFEPDVFCDVNMDGVVISFVSYTCAFGSLQPIYLYLREKKMPRNLDVCILTELLRMKLFSDVDFIKPKIIDEMYDIEMFPLLFDKEILRYFKRKLDIEKLFDLKYVFEIEGTQVSMRLYQYLIINNGAEIFDHLLGYSDFLPDDAFHFIFHWFYMNEKNIDYIIVYFTSIMDSPAMRLEFLQKKFVDPVWCRTDNIKRNILEVILHNDLSTPFNEFINSYYKYMETHGLENHVGELNVNDIHCEIILNNVDQKKFKEVVLEKVKSREPLGDLEMKFFKDIELPTMKTTCIICDEKPNTFALVPCGHLLCRHCIFNVDRCHTCEKHIDKLCIIYE